MSATDSDQSLESSVTGQKGPIGYFAENRVAANLLMLVLLVGGAIAGSELAVQGFPTVDHRTVTVRVPSPGTSPEEVEQDINRRIEESVIGNPGVERVVGVATEGLGQVDIEVSPFADPDTVLDDVQNAVDRIENFPPVSAEQPEVSISRNVRDVMTLAVSSSVLTEHQLRLAAERLRDDLLALPSVSLVDLKGTRDREITIEISEEALRRNGLSLSDVSRIVRQGSVNLTAGELRTGAGGVVLQTLSKRVVGEEFLDIPLITRLDGTIVRLGDVAEIHDGFVDEELVLAVDGVPAVLVQINATASQSIRDVAEIVRGALVDYPVPQDVTIDVWEDRAGPVANLLLTVVQNGLAGVVLVFVCLVVMFDLRVAFWIAFGIPLSFIGALLLFGPADLTLNVLTIFALFMLVGIVVDDAVVVGENIAAEREKGAGALAAAILGARGVVGPICVGVLTTAIAFIPFLFFTAGALQLLGIIPYVVVFVLLISLVEAFFILPAHLSHENQWSLRPLSDVQAQVRAWMKDVGNRVVVPVVSWAVRHIPATIAGGVVVVLAALLLLRSDLVRMVMFEQGNSANYVQADLSLPVGTPFAATLAAAERFAEAGHAINGQLEGTSVARVSVMAGHSAAAPRERRFGDRASNRSHLASVRLHLEERPLRAAPPNRIESAWQRNVSDVTGLEGVVFRRGAGSELPGIAYSLEHEDPQVLRAATTELRAFLESLGGLYEITDSLSLGKRHFDIDLTEAGYAAGLTPADVAGQLRAKFHGLVVQRIQRDRDEVKVVVRYPQEQRRGLSELNTERIQRPGGGEVPLFTVARITERRDFATRTRIDGNQAALLSARADTAVITPIQARALVDENLMQKLMAKYPGIKINPDQGARAEAAMYDTLGVLVPIVLIVMYAIMAGFLRSYWKPIVAVAGIPMAFSGAVFAHWMLGWDFTAISLFGVIGVSGIIVNDALVLLDRYNRIRREEAQLPAIAAVAAATRHRFRAVILTSVTTLLGLSPMIYERADDLIFLVPLVVSIFGGLVFSTLFTVIFLPALVMVVEGRRE
ncbi:MAG: efflux RND transporter permease subunit [Gammaproteobacteria bacterium]|nr:efflux RND transporter permease subunit [Gammaproteobacteria bacterium]